jgi:phosphoribosylformylglycinamidine (FGAM) synthase PurS component
MTMDVLVRRKIADLVRDAAEGALRESCPSLERLDRAELWTFTVEGEDRAVVRRVLEDTTLVANPNVHRWTFREAAPTVPLAPGRARVVVEVHDRVDARGASVLRALRERRGVRSVTGVRRGVLWTIDVAARREQAEALARDVTGTGDAGAGLLANPHAQEASATVTAA